MDLVSVAQLGDNFGLDAYTMARILLALDIEPDNRTTDGTWWDKTRVVPLIEAARPIFGLDLAFPAEAAKALGVTRQRVGTLIKEGKLRITTTDVVFPDHKLVFVEDIRKMQGVQEEAERTGRQIPYSDFL